MHSRHQIIEENLKVETNKALDILKGETPLGDHHHILPGMQTHFMIIGMHVLNMDIKLEIVGNIT